MNRRDLIRTAFGLPLASRLTSSEAADASKLKAPRIQRRVRPGDRSWPSPAKWAKLKSDVGGNLTPVHSLFAACETESHGAACLEAAKSIGNPYWIGDQPGGTQVSGWLDAWTPKPSAYALKARSVADVATGINFARENALMLAVKGGGHSYQGTSNAADSLLIWTRAMRKVTLHETFVAKNCEADALPVAAVSAEAGAMWIDLYNAVTTQGGRYVQGGGCMTVGVAGLIQSGGFGIFSKSFGTAAAALLEAEIVTADGHVRIANARTDPDLFWAIKGGGGGTFGVVTRVTLRTYELPTFFGYFSGTVRANSDEAFARLIAMFVRFYGENLCNSRWGEQVKFSPDNTLDISMVSIGLNASQTRNAWQPFVDWVTASPLDFTWATAIESAAREPRSWWGIEGNPRMVRDPRDGAPTDHAWNQGDQGEIGVFLHGYDSVWLPATLLEQEQQQRLVHALFAASRHALVRLFTNKGLAGASVAVLDNERDTAMNPAASTAFALVIIADGEGPAYPGLPRSAVDLGAARKNAREIELATAEFLNIVPNAGSYVSESSFFNRSWQNAFWGKHYSRLRAVKAKYDPEGLFFVHHGVGSEDWSADGFTRIK